MAVIAVREATGRTLSQSFGDSGGATGERRLICTLDSPATTTQEIINAAGIGLLAPHPEYSYLRMTSATVTENSPTPYHAEVNYQYSVPQSDEASPNPLLRPDAWSFSTSGTSIPAYIHYPDQGNTPQVLVNSANEFFEGASTEEAEVRASIQANRAAFPLSLAVQATNCVNGDAYLGAPPYHWKCAGISAQQVTEIVNEFELRYWQITSELVFRQTGWELQLPNVGYNVYENGELIRGWVQDPEDSSVRIPCANPIALNQDGTKKTSGPPDILRRRVNRVISFSGIFGFPPG